jgi:hypothetical protein
MKLLSSLSFLLFTSTAVFAQEQAITLDKCPAAVKAAIEENIARSRGTLEKIEKETKNGQERYDAKIIDSAGKRWALRVSPEGKVLEAKEKPKTN